MGNTPPKKPSKNQHVDSDQNTIDNSNVTPRNPTPPLPSSIQQSRNSTNHASINNQNYMKPFHHPLTNPNRYQPPQVNQQKKPIIDISSSSSDESMISETQKFSTTTRTTTTTTTIQHEPIVQKKITNYNTGTNSKPSQLDISSDETSSESSSSSKYNGGTLLIKSFQTPRGYNDTTKILDEEGTEEERSNDISSFTSLGGGDDENDDEDDDDDDDDDTSYGDQVYDWLECDTREGLGQYEEEEEEQENSLAISFTESLQLQLKENEKRYTTFAKNIVETNDDIDRKRMKALQSDHSIVTTVKDTHHIKRKRASLPRRKPKVTGGDWLQFRLSVNNYLLLDKIGKGSYGDVRLCKDKFTEKLYAMKLVNKPSSTHKMKGEQSKFQSDEINKTEVAIMKKLRHRNVIRLYEVMDDPKSEKLYMIMEYMKDGDLMQMTKRRKVDDEYARDIMRQICSGLKYLHDNNIVHGDIKPKNVLIHNDRIKIADFGLSKIIHDDQTQLKTTGTPAFMAPEVCSGQCFDGKSSDLYSVGATMYYIRVGHPPFLKQSPVMNNHNRASILIDIYTKIQSDTLSFPIVIAISLQHLIEGLMIKDPKSRFNMERVISDQWLQFYQQQIDQEKKYEDLPTQTLFETVQVSNQEIDDSINYLS